MNSPLRLLLLEDNLDDALLIQNLLTEKYGNNTTVDHATTVNQATQLAQSQKYHLFLVDYMLGEPPNGTEWLTQIAQKMTIPPVIMLTGLLDTEKIEDIVKRFKCISYFITKDKIRSGALTQAIHFTLINLPTTHKSKGTILLVHNDADNVMLIEDALQELDQKYQLDAVEHGDNLIKYLNRQGQERALHHESLPGFIILDLNLSQTDRLQVLKMIRTSELLQRIPMIIFSTESSQRDIHDCYNLGANSFIVKPTSFNALVTMMRNLTSYWFDLVTLPKLL